MPSNSTGAASTTTSSLWPFASLASLAGGRLRPGEVALALAILVFLGLFLVWPVATVIWVAFTEKGTGAFTLVNFADFARTDLFVRAFWNSLYVSAMAVVVASVFALPLAYLTSRYTFSGSAAIQILGFLPLIMPPFVGAVALQLLFGRNGTVNLLLDEWASFKIPFMEGLNGVVFVQAIHYFPFILINLSAALANIDRSMEEAAQNLGSSGFRLFRRIVFPLAMPGYSDYIAASLSNTKPWEAEGISRRTWERRHVAGAGQTIVFRAETVLATASVKERQRGLQMKVRL